VAAGLNQGSTLIANVVLANILVAEEFGRYGAIQLSVTVIASAAQLSAWLSAAHFAGRYRDSSPERLGRVLFVIRTMVAVVAGSVAIALVVARNGYAAVLLADPRAGLEVALAATYILFTGLNAYQLGVLVGLDSLRPYARSSVVQGLAAIALVVAGGYFGGVAAALSGLSAGAVIRWALTERIVSGALHRAGLQLRRDGLAEVVSEVVRFSLPASINGATYMAALWITLNVIVYQPAGLLLGAVYVVCMNLKTLVLFVPQQANSVSVAHLSRYRATAPRDYWRALVWNTGFITSLATMGALAIGVFSTEVLRLYGTEFVEGAAFLQILMIAAVTEAIGYALTQHFSSRGAMWTVFLAASLPRDAILVIGAAYFLPKYGLSAVAWAAAASWLVYSIGLALVGLWTRRQV